MINPKASIVITTHDRDKELAVCLTSLRAQTVEMDVLVMDDKPGERTAEVVAEAFPGARYMHVASGRGPAFQRNYGIREAVCDIVFPFDDDVELVNPQTIEAALADFDNPQVAAVGLPFVNVHISNEIYQHSENGRRQMHAYVGAAHAVRRSVFLDVGGYRDHFFYMGEEGDLCIRLLEAGYTVETGSSPPMHHYESPRRSSKRAATCGRKNDVLFCWHNVPHPFFLPHLVATLGNGIRFSLRSGHTGCHLVGLATGLREIGKRWNERHPVSRETYRTFRQLKRQDATAPTTKAL